MLQSALMKLISRSGAITMSSDREAFERAWITRYPKGALDKYDNLDSVDDGLAGEYIIGSVTKAFSMWQAAKEDSQPDINEASAKAIMSFVGSMVGAFESGFADTANCSIAEVYQVARHYVKDNYNHNTEMFSSVMGDEFAKECLGDSSEIDQLKAELSKANKTISVLTTQEDQHVQEIVELKKENERLNNPWININSIEPDLDFEVLACIDDDVEVFVYRGYGVFEDENGNRAAPNYWMRKPESFYQITDRAGLNTEDK
jgi:hypothetical protein